MKGYGVMLKCDRCGKSIFRKYTGTDYRDGGFTAIDQFETARDWSFRLDVGDLCPECSKELKEIEAKHKSELAEWKESGGYKAELVEEEECSMYSSLCSRIRS